MTAYQRVFVASIGTLLIGFLLVGLGFAIGAVIIAFFGRAVWEDAVVPFIVIAIIAFWIAGVVLLHRWADCPACKGSMFHLIWKVQWIPLVG